MIIESKGNMYTWITHTWNPIKGACPHGCVYCYMHRWGEQRPIRFVESELNTDLGCNNFIFVGSSCDIFANDIPSDWIIKTLLYCEKFNNTYLFQSKNPHDFTSSGVWRLDKYVLCTTIETNRFYKGIMGNSPTPKNRAKEMKSIPIKEKYVTIEPIMDFDLQEMVELIKWCNPLQVNIGADSGHNNLPEPTKEKILNLIDKLKEFTFIDQKRNLKRLMV